MTFRRTLAGLFLACGLVVMAFWMVPRSGRAIVTSDAYGTHVATPGVEMFGIDHDGVIQILRNGNFSCSGSLLEGGFHVLTAGHCVSSSSITSLTVRFTLPSGPVDIEADWWTAHPDYGSVPGTDVGIITLSERAPAAIPRYSPLRTVGMDIDTPNVVFGYGLTGFGETGKDVRDGNKRGGRNRYEATGSTANINNCTIGGSDNERWIFSDFDSGLPANDAFGFHFGKVDLGFGDDEVYASNGDSGAPIFVHNGHHHVIAGVVSGGGRYNGTPNADLDDEVNATWGQFSRDTRVSHADNLAFIESFTSAVVEPQPMEIAASGQGFSVKLTGDVGQVVYVRASQDLVHWEQRALHRLTQTSQQVELFSHSEMQQIGRAFVTAMREPTVPPDPPAKPVVPPFEGGLLGSDSASDELLGISPLTGEGGAFGPTGFNGINGLALDADSGTLYGIDVTTDALVTINPTTGVATTVGSLSVDFPSVAGLAYDPDSDTLYASSNSPAANLYTVNTTSGRATYRGLLPLNFPALAFDPGTDTLFGVSGQSDSLYTINTTTGAATLVGALGIDTSFCGLAYDAVSNQLYLSDATGDDLYTVDRITGAATLVGPLSSNQVNGLAAKNKVVVEP